MDVLKKLMRTREHWERPQVESLKDSNLRTLEINAVTSALRKYSPPDGFGKLADFGCGDGFDTAAFSRYAKDTRGFDYSNEMLSRAQKLESKNLRFTRLDMLSEEIEGTYNAAITKRFLINLGEWGMQSDAIAKITNAILPGGFLFMLECYKQGLEHLNAHRENLGLPVLAEPYHNKYLDIDQTMELLGRQFSLVEMKDFSTYYYFTRCLSPNVLGDDGFDKDESMRKAAESDDLLQGAKIGPQLLLCWRKN